MHNSLHIRDRLRQMNAHPLVAERRDPHRSLMRDPKARTAEGEWALTESWSVRCEVDPAVARPVAADAEDFLRRMGVTVASDAPRQICFRLGTDLGERDFRLTLQPDRVEVEGGGVSGLWAGLAWLELEMRVRRGPFLPRGVIERRASWAVQISQGPWGGNYSVPDFSPEYLSDDSFRLYAHHGVNSMMIYGDLLCYVQSDILPELSHPNATPHLATLQDAARRAARYGVQFSYVVVGPKLRANHPVFLAHPNAKGTGVVMMGEALHFLCSSDEQVIAFYRETFGHLFREVPELAGLILIVAEESFYHCKMWRNYAKQPCPRCAPKTTEQALADLLGPIHEEVLSAQPRAYVAAWPYSTNPWERPDRVEFIRRLPRGIAFYHSVEKDQIYRKTGYTKPVWDYSVDFIGPSDSIQLTATIAREVGRPLFVKTETGIGLEVIQFPYVPALQRLASKWQVVRDLHPQGVQQSWLFFGMFGSRAEALGLWAAYAPEMPADEFLRRLATRDFGPEAAPLVVESWQHMSDAMGHLPVLLFNHYYIGPSFLGPCHPLVAVRGTRLSAVFDGFLFYRQEGGETFSTKHIDQTRTCLAIDSINPSLGLPRPLPGETRSGVQIFVDEYGLATQYAQQAWQCLRRAAPLVRTPADRSNLAEEAALAELVYRTQRACWNTGRFLHARDVGDASAMRQAALDERQNALEALPAYEAAPWLEFQMRTDGYFSKTADMIAEKIRLIDELLPSITTRI